jgi:hypothetical protein
MTVLTLPGQATPGGPRQPVPWRGMAWVTWRQHRVALVGVLGLYAALAVFMLIAGLKIHRDYAPVLACHPSTSIACQGLSNSFGSSDWHMGNAVNIILQLAPMLIGAFAGVPVLARELETGTFRYAWTQGIGRDRWTIAKLTALAVVFAVGAGALSQLNHWFYQPFAQQQGMSQFSAAVFDSQGIALAAWTLAGFAFGAFFGMLIRRVVPAMVATIVAYAGLDLVVWQYLRPHYPVGGFWTEQFFEAGWLLVLSVLAGAATVWLARHRAG